MIAATSNNSITRSLFNGPGKKLFIILLPAVFLLLAIPSESCSSFKTKSKIKLEKNGYKNILIAIEDGVEENYALIDRIKETYTDASKLLFNVTKKRAYFKEIIILLPSSWTLENYDDDFNTNEYYESRILNSTWENYDRADICIETRSPEVIDTPYVVNYATGCGEPSMHLHFTPEYFLNENRALYTFGPYDNVLVHEWAHFRYGVFDEYPHKTLENNQEFYINKKGDVEATRCNANLSGHIRNISDPSGKCHQFLPNGLPSNDCNFIDDIVERDPSKNIGSLMYKPSLKQLTAFCDDDPDDVNTFHNRFAPTLQNKECQGRSVWEVLRSHVDFMNYESLPNDLIDDVTPKFQIVKKRYNKIIVVIDKSLRLNKPDELSKIKAAINDYIKQMVSKQDLIGLIHFESFAEVVLSMTLATDSIVRQKIYELSIPKNSEGIKNSNVFNALSLGVKLLRSTMSNKQAHLPTGGRIVLITNSKADLKYPNRHFIINNVLKNQITIDVLEISDTKDPLLESLSAKTDGQNFLINNRNELLDISDSMIELANRELKPVNHIVELSDSFFMQNEKPINTQFILVDGTISSREDSVLCFKFSFEKLKEHVEVVVVDPNNKKHMLKTMDKCRDTSLFETTRRIDKTKQDVVCKFESPSKGKWVFSIINPVEQKFYVKLKVFVYYKQSKEVNSYYPNYYSNRLSKQRHRRLAAAEKNAIHKRNSKNIDMINLNAKWSKETVNYPKDTQIVYASVSRNLQPILNASVRALIYRPTGDYISLELYDNGLNADRYANDGVYTRYFSNFNVNGVYFARIELRTNLFSTVHTQKIVGMNSFDHFPTLGVVNKLDNSVFYPIDQVQRTNFIGSFNLKNFNVNDDLIKPSMIKDMRVIDLDESNGLVTLKFTAPGDNADIGTASKYEMKASYDPQILIDHGFYEDTSELKQNDDNQHIIPIVIYEASFTNSTPNQGGFEEFMTIDIQYLKQDTISIKIRAIDSHENRGRWSPILTVKLNRKVKLSKNLKHYENNNLSQHLKVEEKEESDNIYWELFVFLIVLFCTIGITQIAFLIVLSTIEIVDRRRNQIKPVRV